MAERITDEDLELLGDLGVEALPDPGGGRSAKEQRIIAGFEEIERFVEEHGRAPQHGEGRDIFERLYAVRLDRMRDSPECRAVLKDLDKRGLLDVKSRGSTEPAEHEPTDDELLAALGVEATPENDITRLVHVRSREEIKAAEEIARRAPCRDFDQFKPAFEKVQHELQIGERRTIKYGGETTAIKKGYFFILEGQTLLVADVGEEFVSEYERKNRRLRVIYDNGTESEPLLRSLQRALYEDKTSRRITEPGVGPLFADNEEEDDLATGYVYVFRSKSDNPYVAQHRDVIHKIGVTGGDVKARVANARKDPTYLLADVEIVATYKLANINRNALEALLHKVFRRAQLELELKDRFGSQVEPREWFLVPLAAIDEAIQKLKEGTISNFRYDPEIAALASF
jgi:hypothetical protein